MESLNKWLSIVSAIVLLIVTTILALMGKSVEMGLTIIAGAIGLSFANIEKIRRFKGAGFEAEMWDKIQTIVDKETEIETDSISETIGSRSTDRMQAVLSALGDPRYTWRYLGGLARDARLEMDEAKEELSSLVDQGYAKTIKGRRGPLWTLTNSGRIILARQTRTTVNS